MASAIMILLWVQNEMSYDRFHAKTDRIYKVYNRDNVNGQLEALGQTPIFFTCHCYCMHGFIWPFSIKHCKQDKRDWHTQSAWRKVSNLILDA